MTQYEVKIEKRNMKKEIKKRVVKSNPKTMAVKMPVRKSNRIVIWESLQQVLIEKERGVAWLANKLGCSRQSLYFQMWGEYRPKKETLITLGEMFGGVIEIHDDEPIQVFQYP